MATVCNGPVLLSARVDSDNNCLLWNNGDVWVRVADKKEEESVLNAKLEETLSELSKDTCDVSSPEQAEQDSVVDSVKLEGKKDDMEDSVSSMQNPDANEPEPTPLGNEEQEVKNPAKDLVEPKCTDEVVKEHVNDPEVKEEAILVDDTQHEVKTMDQVNEVPLQMEA